MQSLPTGDMFKPVTVGWLLWLYNNVYLFLQNQLLPKTEMRKVGHNGSSGEKQTNKKCFFQTTSDVHLVTVVFMHKTHTHAVFEQPVEGYFMLLSSHLEIRNGIC